MDLAGEPATAGAEAGSDAFLGVWRIFWALGWVFATSSIALQLGGSEIIKVIGRDLKVSIGGGRWRRRKLRRGDQIRNLSKQRPQPDGLALPRAAIAVPRHEGGVDQVRLWREDDPRGGVGR